MLAPGTASHNQRSPQPLASAPHTDGATAARPAPRAQGGTARATRSGKKKAAAKSGGGTGYGGSVGERTSKAALAAQAAAAANAEQYDKAMSAAVDRLADLLPQAKAAGGLSAAAGAAIRCGGVVPILHLILRVGSLMAIGERPAVYLAALRLVGRAPSPRQPPPRALHAGLLPLS